MTSDYHELILCVVGPFALQCRVVDLPQMQVSHKSNFITCVQIIELVCLLCPVIHVDSV